MADDKPWQESMEIQQLIAEILGDGGSPNTQCAGCLKLKSCAMVGLTADNKDGRCPRYEKHYTIDEVI